MVRNYISQERQKIVMKKEQIDEVLREMIADYSQKALAYMLHFETGERRLEQDKRKELQEKYGKEAFSPVLDWSGHFGELADSDILDERINALLQNEGYDKEEFVIPRDRLKNKLWNEARRQAHDILNQIQKEQ